MPASRSPGWRRPTSRSSRLLEISDVQLATAAGAAPGTINAFLVKVFDGSRSSAASQIQVTTVNSYQSVVWDTGSFFVSATNVSWGQTYQFDLNVPGEPFTLQTVGGGYDPAFVYDDGVTGNGETSGQLSWIVPESGPDELFYQSAATPEFGGKIIVARLPLD